MSNRDEWPDNPNDPQPESAAHYEEKSGGGCLKWVLILGGLGLLSVLVCCGGGVWLMWGSLPKMVGTPAEVAAVSQEIMQIDIPPDYIGEAGMSADNFIFAMRFATYRHKEGKGQLLIGSMQVKLGASKDQQAEFKNTTRERSDNEKKLTITNTEDREFTIRGKKVPFKFSEATEEGTDKKYRLVEGELEGAGTMAVFQLTLEEDAYDEEAVVKMIESIR